MKLLIINLIATTYLFAFGGGKGGGSSYKSRTDWQNVYKEEGFKSDCTVKVKYTIKVKGTLDGKGCLYKWVGKYADKCHASKEYSESLPRMFEMSPGSTLKNMKIECSPDGIMMNDNTTISNVEIWDAEEDAITTNGKNNVIRNNKIYLCQDKCIQMNQASPLTIEGNFFKHAARPMSGSNSKGGADKIKATGNKCVNCEIMIRAQSDHDIEAKDNKIDGGECMFETVDKGVIYDKGGNVATGGAILKCNDGTGNVK